VFAADGRDVREARYQAKAGLKSLPQSNINLQTKFAILLVLGFIAGCSSKPPAYLQAIESTRTAEQILTLGYGDEIRSLIEAYFMKSLSLAVQKEPDTRSEFETGPHLKAMFPFTTPEPVTRFHIATSVALDEIHVLEHTPSKIRAIGCGKVFTDEVSFDGDYIKTNTPFSIMQIFVFVREDNAWKVFTRYDFGDTKGAIRDWAYVSDEEKQAIGDLQMSIDMYWGYGLNLKD
jgi:hypothetical protein